MSLFTKMQIGRLFGQVVELDFHQLKYNLDIRKRCLLRDTSTCIFFELIQESIIWTHLETL